MFEIGQEFMRNGYVRKVLFLDDNFINVQTIGVPAFDFVRSSQNIPKSGLVSVDNFKKWVEGERNNQGRQAVQLLI